MALDGLNIATFWVVFRSLYQMTESIFWIYSWRFCKLPVIFTCCSMCFTGRYYLMVCRFYAVKCFVCTANRLPTREPVSIVLYFWGCICFFISSISTSSGYLMPIFDLHFWCSCTFAHFSVVQRCFWNVFFYRGFL